MKLSELPAGSFQVEQAAPAPARLSQLPPGSFQVEQPGLPPAFLASRPDLVAPGAPPTVAPVRPEDRRGVAEAIAHTVAQEAGGTSFGDELAAALDVAASKESPLVRGLLQRIHGDHLPPLTDPNITYQQRVDAYRREKALGKQQHPAATTIADLASTAATAGGAARLLGAPALVTPSGVAQAAKVGAALGAVRGAGEAQSIGEIPGHALTSAALGAAAGPLAYGAQKVLSGVAARASEKARDMVDDALTSRLAESDLGKRIFGRLAKQLAGKNQATLAETIKDGGIDVTNTTKGLARTEELIGKLAERDPLYASLDQAVGGVSVPDFQAYLGQQIAELGKRPAGELEQKALQAVYDRVADTWGKHGVKIAPTIELRDFVSDAQKVAARTLGSLTETTAAPVKRQVAGVIKSYLDAHLDAAAEAAPQLADTVAAVRNFNNQFTHLAAIRDAFENRAMTEATGAKGLAKILGIGAVKGVLGAQAADMLGSIAGAPPEVMKPLGFALASGMARLPTGGKGLALGALARFALQELESPAAIERAVAKGVDVAGLKGELQRLLERAPENFPEKRQPKPRSTPGTGGRAGRTELLSGD